MPLPEPQHPEPDPPTPDTPAHPPGYRPDWLVGAEDFRAPEPRRTDGAQDAPQAAKPVGESPASHLSLVRPVPGPPPARESASEPRRAWSAAASSIPSLRREHPAAVEQPAPRDAMEFEPEDRERAPMPEFLENSQAATPAPALPPLREAWWVVALEGLRSNGRVQIAVGAVLVAFAVFTFWPRHEPSVSISYLRHHASEVDGRAVTVRGRVGDVFPMGTGYSFYLRQGHESIVVFTRTRQPVMNQTISVKGTISTGYLDGAPHQSLFEQAK
jgi:hypothetical protein